MTRIVSDVHARSVPVTVVTGFLGAGKTTLVNRWLADVVRGSVAVIVNEIGATGIDGELLAARVETLVEIAGGCVCCSTQAELARALDALATSPSAPKRILIETSGAASPAGVLHVIRGGIERGTTFLDGVVTVVDASSVERVLAEHDLAVEQVGYADVVVLSRSDTCSTSERERAEAAVAAHNGAALIVSAARGAIDDPKLDSLESLLEARAADFVGDVGQSSRPLADHAYESIALACAGAVDGDRFAHFMEEEVARFAGRIFRTKGILAVDDVEERMIVQGVADLVEVTFGEPWGGVPRTSRFVIVGYGLERDALTQAFAACAITSASVRPS